MSDHSSHDSCDDFIEIYDGALSADACRAITARFDASDKVQRGRTGQGVDVSKKDSYDLTLDGQADWADVHQLLVETTLKHLQDYMRKYRFLLMGALSPTLADPATGRPTVLSVDNFERLGEPLVPDLVEAMYRCGRINLQKYLGGSGGYHHWHSELYPQDAGCESLHRVLLFQFYLNDVAEGGETEFFYQRRSIEPRAGRLVIAPAGFTHTHKGHVPRSGDKYIATSWILFRRAEQLYGG